MSPDTIVLIVAISLLSAVCLFAVWVIDLQGLIRSRLVLPARVLATIFSLLVVTYLLWNLENIQAHYWVLISLYVGLVGVTVVYALSTHRQANASAKMAEGMAHPVIDFKRDTAKTDRQRIDLEVYAAIHEETSHGLSCILCNVGVGSAIDVRSFIQHPERGRLPREFGTIESRGKTERWILSISHEGNRIALVASYEDIYGRTLESSREVSIDKENHNWKLGRLKVVPVKEE